jgi:hypothetical protein
MALGWEWHAQSFYCPPDKFAVQLHLIKDWVARSRSAESFTVLEIERLIGLLNWVTTAAPVIRPLVAAARSALYCRNARQGKPVVLGKEATAAVSLLLDFYQSWDRSSPIALGFTPISPWGALIRTDASTEFGAGGFSFPSRIAFIHRWSTSERAAALRHVRESTTFLELQAILLSLHLFGSKLRGLRVQFECDSEPAVRALLKCFSPEPGCNDTIREICLFCTSYHITPRWEHILSSFNSVADALSHNLFSQAQSLLDEEVGGNLSLVPSQ